METEQPQFKYWALVLDFQLCVLRLVHWVCCGDYHPWNVRLKVCSGGLQICIFHDLITDIVIASWNPSVWMDQTGLPGAWYLCERSKLMLITKTIILNGSLGDTISTCRWPNYIANYSQRRSVQRCLCAWKCSDRIIVRVQNIMPSLHFAVNTWFLDLRNSTIARAVVKTCTSRIKWEFFFISMSCQMHKVSSGQKLTERKWPKWNT